MAKTVDMLQGPFDPGGQPEMQSPHKMLVGLFAWNVSGGGTISKAVLADPARYRDYWQWPRAKRLLQLAEQVGFDFEVPFGRYLGHGGVTGFNDEQLDVITSAAALSQVTERLLLFSTAHITYGYHPLHFARFGTQIDYMSAGRWGLNVVTGWFAEEYAMFSGALDWLPHDERYAMADEFVTLLKWLWTSDTPIDCQGKYYKSLGGLVKVKPARKPRPILVNAGHSDAGIDFAAKHCEWLFCSGPNLETLKEHARKARERAAHYGRRLRLLTFTYNIIGDTNAEAKERFDWTANEVDQEAADRFIGRLQQQPQMSYARTFVQRPVEQLPREEYLKIALGLGGWWVVGGPETQAEMMQELHRIGFEGVLVTFFEPQRGVHYFGEKVFPLLKKMGLRT